MFKGTNRSVLLNYHVQEFLQKLRQGSVRDVKNLLECLGNLELAVILESVEFFIKKLADEKDFTVNELISDNFFILLLGSLDWARLSVTSKLLRTIYNILALLNEEQKLAMVKNGLFIILAEVLAKESETGKIITAPQNNGPTVTTAQFIAEFLPKLPKTNCYEEVDSISIDIIFTGQDLAKQNNCLREVIYILELTLKTTFNICQKASCLVAHHFLLVKLIYWSNYLNELTNFLRIKDVIDYLKTLMLSEEQDKVVIGFATVHAMLTNHVNSFYEYQLHETINRARLFVTPTDWIEDDYEILTGEDLRTPKLLIDCINDLSFQSFDKQRELVRSILEYIIPNFGEISGNGQTDIELNYSRLTSFVKSILHISGNIKDSRKMFSVDEDAIKNFDAVVAYVMSLMGECNAEDLQSQKIRDMKNEFNSTNERYSTPNDINLFSTRSAAFDRVLGPSLNPDQLRNSTLIQVLRLLSIFHEVNENWGVLFSKHLTDRLISRDSFAYKCLAYNENFSDELLCNVIEYRFLFPYETREKIFLKKCNRRSSSDWKVHCKSKFRISRNNIVNDFAKFLLSDNIHTKYFEFSFVGEPSTGKGPAVEFYSEFSRNCQRHELDLWIGDPIADSNGFIYVDSPSGLYPKPRLSLQPHSALQLKAIGRVIARCIRDGKEIDFNFSKAFFKHLFGAPAISPDVTLSDLKDVMPHVFAFVVKLLDILNKRLDIEKDESLSLEERRKAISDINFDGSSFEDLCLNFTIPGFPEVEMKEGGKEILLSIENAEEYLKLLIWCVLYKGPQIYVNAIIKGFDSMLPVNSFKILYVEEIEYLLCGEKDEKWTLDYLKDNFKYSEYSLVIKFLFEFLVSSSASTRKKFLQFVTGSNTMPRGSLQYVNPKISICVESRSLGFPSAHTCHHNLIIPNYNSKEDLEEKFLLSFRYGFPYGIP